METEENDDFMTRAEYRERVMNTHGIDDVEFTQYVSDELGDFTTRAGFIARSRKAFVAGIGALAGAFGPALIAAGADGVITWAEIMPAIVVGTTLAGGTFILTWRVSNAEG